MVLLVVLVLVIVFLVLFVPVMLLLVGIAIVPVLGLLFVRLLVVLAASAPLFVLLLVIVLSFVLVSEAVPLPFPPLSEPEGVLFEGGSASDEPRARAPLGRRFSAEARSDLQSGLRRNCFCKSACGLQF